MIIPILSLCQVLSLCQMWTAPLIMSGSQALGTTLQAPLLKQVQAKKQVQENASHRQEHSGLPYVGLTAIAETGITLQGDNVAEANLGTIDTSKTHDANFTFTLRNTSGTPITVDRIEPSCQCTTASVTIGGTPIPLSQILPPLSPGMQASIHVHIALTDQLTGNLAKFVAIYIKDIPQPAAMLQIRGILTSQASSETTQLLAPPTQEVPFQNVPFVGLRVVAAASLKSLALNQAEQDFGPVAALHTPQLEQRFTLINSGTTPLVLDRLEPSCHCTTASVEGASADAALPTLAPGQKAIIHVTIHLADFAPGPFRKSVQVLIKGNLHPAATLILIGSLNTGSLN